jgi:hypothetical protein
MSFDEILNFMSDLTKKEIFTCTSFSEYVLEQRKGDHNKARLETKYAHFKSDFDFIQEFKERARQIEISNNLMAHLETKWNMAATGFKKAL